MAVMYLSIENPRLKELPCEQLPGKEPTDVDDAPASAH